jgi:hypothetical protein
MNKKLTWEDVIPTERFSETYGLYTRAEIITRLEKAEKEGKVCLNPPTEEEIRRLVAHDYIKASVNKSKDWCVDVAKAISKRLRGE